ATNHRVVGVREPDDVLHDRLHDGLQVARRTADHTQDLSRRRLLLLRLLPKVQRLRLLLESLLQALLQIVDPGAVVLGRLARTRRPAFLGLRGLWTPAHGPPFASSMDRPGTG